MNQSIFRISLDIHSVASQLSFSVNRGDNMRSLIITLTENGKMYEITGDCYAIFTTVKPDGNTIANDCVIQDNTIRYDFTEQTTAVAGKLDCSVVVFNTKNERITSPRFTVIVYETTHQNINLTSESEYTILTSQIAESVQCIEEANGKIEEMTALIETVTEERDSGAYKGEQGEQGEQGKRGYSMYSYSGVISESPSISSGVTYNYTESLVKRPSTNVHEGSQFVDNLGNIYLITSASLQHCKFTGVNISGVPDGGEEGHVLVKTEGGAEWQEIPSGGGGGGGEIWFAPQKFNYGDDYYGMHYGVLVPKGFSKYTFCLASKKDLGVVTFTAGEMSSSRNTQWWYNGLGITYTPDGHVYGTYNYYGYDEDRFWFFEYNNCGSDTDSIGEIPYVKMEV